MPEPPTETVNHGDIQHFGIPAFHPSIEVQSISVFAHYEIEQF